MATLLAPYNTAMQLGSGFNSYTQQLCVDHAVISTTEDGVAKAVEHNQTPVAQEVTYKSSIVDKVTDVTSAMNINAAFAIKYDTFDAKGKGDFLNTSKVKESDVSFMISVKVVNQVIYDHSLTKFNPISDLKATNFVDVYGDSFISGYQEGGEFTAVISVKARNQEEAKNIKANAAVTFTKEKLDFSADGNFSKDDLDFLEQNETTVSVTYTGGGQDLKKPDEDWSFATMRTAALRFADLVALTPMRTHAILTKYTALRSFYSATIGSSRSLIPNYERAGVYTNLLQEAYLDYKTIAKNLQVLAFDVSAGVSKLIEAPAGPKSENSDAAHHDPAHDSDNDSIVAVAAQTGGDKPASASVAPLRITQPYPATLAGLEAARNSVRLMLSRIFSEVDLVTRSPDLAVDENRRLPYMSPFLFKEYLPIGVAIPAAQQGPQGGEGEAPASTKEADDIAAMADRMGGSVRF